MDSYTRTTYRLISNSRHTSPECVCMEDFRVLHRVMSFEKIIEKLSLFVFINFTRHFEVLLFIMCFKCVVIVASIEDKTEIFLL